MKIHRTLSVSVASLAAFPCAAFPCAALPCGAFSCACALNDPARSQHSQLDPETLRLVRAAALAAGITGAILSAALVYRKCAKHTPLATEMRPFSGDSHFEYGLCEGLCHSWRITCWGCCCSPVLWSATASSPKSKLWGWDFWWMMGLMTTIFSLAFFLAQMPKWFGIWGVNITISSLVAFHILLMVHHRQHLRRIFSMEHGTFRSVIQDFFTWVCCGVCATIQEALQVGYVADPVLNTPLQDDGTAPVPMHMLPWSLVTAPKRVLLTIVLPRKAFLKKCTGHSVGHVFAQQQGNTPRGRASYCRFSSLGGC